MIVLGATKEGVTTVTLIGHSISETDDLALLASIIKKSSLHYVLTEANLTSDEEANNIIKNWELLIDW
jgi:hypothetical protein